MLANPSPGSSAQTRARIEALLGADHVEVPRDAVRAAYEAVVRCTENDVAGMAGTLAWGLPLRYLRDELCPGPDGWRTDRTGNFETVVSPDKKFAITSARGDERTGTDKMPATCTDKGPRTKKAVRINQDQLAFDPQVVGSPTVVPLRRDITTWFLLHHYDEHAGEVRLELSIPVKVVDITPGLSGNDRVLVTEFDPDNRLILDPIVLVDPEPNDDRGDQADEIDVPVSRRAT